MERLAAKFSEGNFEKVDRLLEIHSKYSNRMVEEEKNGQTNLELSDEELYLKKLDVGLFTLQQADLVIMFLCHPEFVGSNSKNVCILLVLTYTLVSRTTHSIFETREPSQKHCR